MQAGSPGAAAPALARAGLGRAVRGGDVPGLGEGTCAHSSVCLSPSGFVYMSVFVYPSSSPVLSHPSMSFYPAHQFILICLSYPTYLPSPSAHPPRSILFYPIRVSYLSSAGRGGDGQGNARRRTQTHRRADAHTYTI